MTADVRITTAVKKSDTRLEEFFRVLFLGGTFSFTWSIKNTGIFSKWVLLRILNTLAVLHALLLSWGFLVAIRQNGEVSLRKFLRVFCFLFFFLNCF